MRIAIIDIGSNTVKFDLYDTEPTLLLLLRRAETVGLVHYIKDGKMSGEGTAALCGVLSDFSRILDGFGCTTCVPVATASLRGLSNAAEVTEAVFSETGMRIRILPGEEEARISYESVRAMFPQCPSKGLTVDMGGGSTDVIRFDGDLVEPTSFSFGALRLHDRFVRDIRPKRKEMKTIRAFVGEEMKRLSCPNGCGETVMLVGGTSKAIGKLLCEKENVPFENGVSFPLSALEKLEKKYRDPGRKEIDAMIRFAPERLHTLIPGLSAHLAICRAVGCRTVVFTAASLRDGIIRRIIKGEWTE